MRPPEDNFGNSLLRCFTVFSFNRKQWLITSFLYPPHLQQKPNALVSRCITVLPCPVLLGVHTMYTQGYVYVRRRVSWAHPIVTQLVLNLYLIWRFSQSHLHAMHVMPGCSEQQVTQPPYDKTAGRRCMPVSKQQWIEAFREVSNSLIVATKRHYWLKLPGSFQRIQKSSWND